MLRWKKIPHVIRWTIHAVDLHEDVPGEFSISWQRGDITGQTDPQRPDSNRRLIINANFECPCKLYVDKKSGQARPKKIKIILNRHLPDGQTKVYGNLPIEVGQYLNSKAGVTLAVEMESGRDVAPTLHISVSLRKAGEEIAATTADSWDQSFMEEPVPHVPLAQWDTGADSSQGRKGSADEGDAASRRHRQRTNTTDSPDALRRARMQSAPLEGEPGGQAEAEMSPVSEQGRSKPREAPAPAPPPEEDIVRRKPRKQGASRAKSGSLDAFMGKMQTEERAGAKASLIQPAETEAPKEVVIETPQDFLRNIIVRHWPEPLNPPQFLPGLPYPSLVFPLFAGILHQKVFEAEGSQFETNIDVIIGELRRKDLAPKQKFFTLLALLLLITEEQVMVDADRNRVQMFAAKLQHLISEQSLRVLQAQLAQTDVLVNRFATAVFHMQHLLRDFRDVTQAVRRSFKYGDVLNRFLMNMFLGLFERKLLNKLIQNPARFNFKNAVLWNSLVNAYENDERVPLPLLREAISGLMMTPNISKDPTLFQDVCPSLTPNICVFFCKHFHPDDTVTQPINCIPVLQAFKITDVPLQLDPFPMVVELDFKQLVPAASLPDWCRFALGEPCVREAPFLKPFARAR
jgi:hypothetical protein